jgi:signal transduction histidine kinase/DNA-binding response OmpR family regulator
MMYLETNAPKPFTSMGSQTRVSISSDDNDLARVNVLLVDDKPENLVALETLLKNEDDRISYLLCRSGEAALKVAMKEEIALILLDVQMPDMDGYEVARLLKNNSRTNHIPIIFVTAIDRGTEEVVQGFESGGVDYLFKPLNPAITKAKVSAFVKIHQQNKELQRKNRLLKEKQQIIEQTQHLAGIGTWEWNLEKDQISLSETLAQLFDLRTDTPLTSEAFFDTVHPEDRANLKGLLEQAQVEDEYVWYEYRAQIKGKSLYIVGKFSVEQPEGMEPVKLKGYSQNVTSLRESQALLERVFNVSLNAICTLTPERDSEGRIRDFLLTRANLATADILGYRPEDLPQSSFLEIFPQANESGLLDACIEVVEKGVAINTEHLHQLPALSRYLHLLVSRLEDGLVMTFSDISGRKQSEEQLKRAHQELASAHQALLQLNNELEERVKERTKDLLQAETELREINAQLRRINSDLDNFVYTASHDLKAPINNIEGLMGMMKKHLPVNDEKVDRIMFMLEQSISRFKNVLKELTEVTRVKHSLLQDVAQIAFKPLIEEAKMTLKDPIEQTGASITEDLQVPSLKFSSKNLRSILYNLISNAVKYRSPDRAPEIQVRTYQSEDGFLVLSVQDNGLGIREDQIPKMFDIFKRLHTHEEGSGIGLYLVRKIVEDSGGRIEVESEYGKGTLMRIFFKMANDAAIA